MVVVGGGPAGITAAVTCKISGLEVLLVERGDQGRHKPCGGVLPPICTEIIPDILEEGLPNSVMATPEKLGLYYIPPSGRRNGGRMDNYSLLNIDRDNFDRWLHQLAIKQGVQVSYRTSLTDLEQSDCVKVRLDQEGETRKTSCRYLIGADGVHSKVRRNLYGKDVDLQYIIQESLRAEGDLQDCFYALFRGNISPTYGYLIPKNGHYLIGVGGKEKGARSLTRQLSRLKIWLKKEFRFNQKASLGKETWAIPHGSTYQGVNRVILAGDAAGFCNPLSGEGVRLAIESGETAGASITEAIKQRKKPSDLYTRHIQPITRLIHQTYRFAANMTDRRREEFVASELSRTSLL